MNTLVAVAMPEHRHSTESAETEPRGYASLWRRHIDRGVHGRRD
jgi:hypothetical protein